MSQTQTVYSFEEIGLEVGPETIKGGARGKVFQEGIVD